MQERFEIHKQKMLIQCEVMPQIFDDMIKRLDALHMTFFNSYRYNRLRISHG